MNDIIMGYNLNNPNSDLFTREPYEEFVCLVPKFDGAVVRRIGYMQRNDHGPYERGTEFYLLAWEGYKTPFYFALEPGQHHVSRVFRDSLPYRLRLAAIKLYKEVQEAWK